MPSLRHLMGPNAAFEGYDTAELCDERHALAGQTDTRKKTNGLNGHARGDVSDFVRLARTIETEIVPRLILAHRTVSDEIRAAPATVRVPSEEDVATFGEIVLRQDVSAAHRYIDALCERDVPLETIFLDLLAPAARYLGQLWVDDVCDFADVTLGLSRMQQVLNALSPAFGAAGPQLSNKHALLITLPGEQHTFGVNMVAEFFRRDGWDVWCGAPESEEEVLDLVHDQPFDVVGFSVGCDGLVPNLEPVVGRIKKASHNRSVNFLAGGRVFAAHPEWAARSGVNAIGLDGRDAVRRAHQLLGATVPG